MRQPISLRAAARARSLSAVLIAFLASACLPYPGGDAHAQGRTDSPAQHYDIPPGPLAEALSRYAQQSGAAIVMDAADLQGLRTPGLTGTHGIEEGFRLLLQGSGFAVTRTSAGYLLRKAPGMPPVTALPSITVQASAPLDGTTEGTGSYTTHSMGTATGLALSMRETPQSLSVISRQRMDDQAMVNIEDAVEGTPGIVMQKAGGERVTFYARGFWIRNLTYDGLPSYYDGDTVASPDLAMYDRVEIVRGATGLTTGAGTPSAAINMVRKKPTHDFQMSVTGSVGRWNNFRSDVDVSGPLNAQASVRGRAVVGYQNKDSFVDVVNNESTLLYATLAADLGPRTLLTVGGALQRDNNRNTWGGVPWAADGSDLHLPRNSYFGYDWEFWDKENKELFADLEHRLANGWKIRVGASKRWSRMEYLGTHLLNYGTWSQAGAHYAAPIDTANYALQVSGPFTLLGRRHELIWGANLQKTHRMLAGGQGTLLTSGIDVHNWRPDSLPKPDFDLEMLRNEYRHEQRSTFLATRWNPADRLKLILGARLDWYDYDARTRWMGTTSAADYQVTRHPTYYAGVIYDLDAWHSAYASYTDIFEPQSERTLSGDLIDPIVGENYEVGIKGEYFEGTLNTSLALFRILQKNRAALLADQAGCPANSCYGPTGKVRSQGIEAEVSGELTRQWRVAAGYTWTDAEYVRNDADPGLEGQRFDTAFPQHLFKLSTLYRLSGEWGRWRVGGGVQWQSGTYMAGLNAGQPFRIEQKAYAVANLLVGFQASSNLDLQLNVSNLFDKRYYHSLGSHPGWGGVARYGTPRNFLLTARYTF